MSKTTTYTAEFKAEAVKLVNEQGLSHQEAAQRLGIPKGSLSNWVSLQCSRARSAAGTAMPRELSREQLQAELARLRRELARVEMEREIVKRAAAYFAKESLQDTRS